MNVLVSCTDKIFLSSFQGLAKRSDKFETIKLHSTEDKFPENIYTDDIIILLNFIFTGLHGDEITPGLSTNKVHSLSSGKVAATPILKSVPSQFSSFILKITVSLHAYKTILAQSRPQR